jgi:hypothetical protein
MRLDLRCRRPGLAHEELDLALDSSTATRIAGDASREGVPSPLWAAIAIESERALCAAARTDRARRELRLYLDSAARQSGLGAQGDRRLEAYATALRQATARTRDASATTCLTLLVPYHTLLAWEIAADHEDTPLLDWARSRLLAVGPGRPLWEAAAAERGQTLGEWVALCALGAALR